jgi:hypothetical protein
VSLRASFLVVKVFVPEPTAPITPTSRFVGQAITVPTAQSADQLIAAPSRVLTGSSRGCRNRRRLGHFEAEAPMQPRRPWRGSHCHSRRQCSEVGHTSAALGCQRRLTPTPSPPRASLPHRMGTIFSLFAFA